MRFKGARLEEVEDVIEDLELVGFVEYDPARGLRLTEEYKDALWFYLPLLFGRLIRKVGRERLRESVDISDSRDILASASTFMSLERIAAERIKRGMPLPERFEEEYADRLYRFYYAMLDAYRRVGDPFWRELVDYLNSLLAPLGARRKLY